MGRDAPPPGSGSTLSIIKIEDAAQLERYLSSLRRLLQHCVNDDPSTSSIGFFAPLSDHAAVQYWLELLPSVLSPGSGAAPTTTLLVSTTSPSGAPDEVVATVQVARMLKETHTYKGEIRKLLVHPSARRGGVGRAMMDEAERVARCELGLELLVLDTATETSAREFYLRTGWTEWGLCPDYAKMADGPKTPCSFFVKMLQ